METRKPMAAAKLLLDEKVEVRSLEDGFLGSWHAGVVSGCEKLVRMVRYDHILCDDGPDKLVERVTVTPAIEGVVEECSERPGEYRGLIRPSPPSCNIGIWSLHYGECVDLLHMDAWWEGVVFDHDDGSEKRRIFFPDLGDEMVGSINDLRLSMDWDEVTDEWKPRGNWLFLELMEEVERDWPLPVSVKQMWYEGRMKNDFEKLGEWTSSERDLWKDLIVQVFSDNLEIAVKQIFADVNSSLGPGQSSIEFSEEVFDSVLKSEGLFHSSLAVVPFKATLQSVDEGIQQTDLSNKNDNGVLEQNDQVPVSVRLTDEHTPPCCSRTLPILSCNPVEDSAIGSNDYDKSPSVSLKLQEKNKNRPSKFKWELHNAHYEPENLPDTICECNKIYMAYERKNIPSELRYRAYKYLVHLGWKIESARDDGGFTRRRYSSPKGKVYDSFRKVCKALDHGSGSISAMLMGPKGSTKLSVSSSEETLSRPGKSLASIELSKSCTSDDMLNIKPEKCHEVVRDYYLLCSRKKFLGLCSDEAKLKAMEVKKHLSLIGWSFHYHKKLQRKREPHFTSPSGKLFYSLVSACKWFLDSALTPAVGRVTNINLSNNIDDKLSTSKSHLPLIAMDSPESLPDKFGDTQPSNIPTSKDIVQSVEVEAYKTRMLRKRKMHDKSHCIEGSLPPKRRRKSHASIRRRGDLNADSSTSVRRSSKRVRERVASSSQPTPQTILSWLIENNVILPRARVQYRGGENGPPKAEGRITREGIKCSCCRDIFSLSKFEIHAGSNDQMPSANIVLEDGRSLLECQLQLKRRSINRSLRLERENKGTRHNRTNDTICSVCHYGGELVLCDQCPSSFHIQCLGLKEVPDGDWFCASCCCQICNKSRLNKVNRQSPDSSFLVCGQCERRYHADCIEKKRDTNFNSEGDWFCHDTCQHIFYGLREILGKKIPVGTESMTWRLVKYIESDISKLDTSNKEDLVEVYSKLNVALNVMHECFEPVKESRTRRDLMEDVIFNRWSELNRLNFQGFYTVILEKDDEMVSVATVRIYGKIVAEVPLVATRFHYRRHGMCRILMDELEKKLAELGVERLVLPAIPSVLHTWTTSFGFSQMSESERLNFLAYTFLNFQGTVFCQKVLNGNLSAVSTLSAETQANSCNNVPNNDNNRVDEISAVSEAREGIQIADTDISQQESTCIKTVVNDGNAICSAQTITVVDQLTPPNCSYFQPRLECPPSVAATENGNAGCPAKAVVVVDQPILPECSPLETPVECCAVAVINDNKDACCSNETAIVIRPTLHDHSASQNPLECAAVVSNDEKPQNNRDSLLKYYKRRRISAC